MKKKIVNGLLAACLLTGGLSTTALAETGDTPEWMLRLNTIGVYTNDDNDLDGLFWRWYDASGFSDNNDGNGIVVHMDVRFGGFATSDVSTFGTYLGAGYQTRLDMANPTIAYAAADLNFQLVSIEGASDNLDDVGFGVEAGFRTAPDPRLLLEGVLRYDTNDLVDQASLRAGLSYDRFTVTLTRFFDAEANQIELGYLFFF
ncbi:hypothetical protein [Isoalcanivorax indicus]|uniref:hypothetical protein n=1 Tax=Isoalcanivorax indicus TaxID=2202653 RepID=UPI000DB9361C|nr:hypothetical protein [Isoalcanivorax indicus]